MNLIIGLGNPGQKYQKTRHNIGWQVLDILIDKKENWKQSKKSNCFYIRKEIENQEIEIIKPLTFMNNSGSSVAYMQKKHKVLSENIIVIHDDIDLPLGKIRIKIDGSAGGHNGVQSIIDHLKTENFIRLKIGVANEKRGSVPAEKFVLQKFDSQEKELVKKIITKVSEILKELITSKKIKEQTFSL